MTSRTYDALVIGAGFAGLYELYLLKQLGLNVLAIDSAGDVGGTWYWTRYPGARSDVESQVYRYSWDKELLQTWPWPNNYLTQPEVETYLQEIARKHDLYPLIQFNLTVKGATWDDDHKVWKVEVSTGEIVTVRYLAAATGLVHKTSVPPIPGLDTFKGRITHSASWTSEIEHEGKRVAVIGSGASGVQLTSALGEKAQSLIQFIRHAQYVLPAALRPVSPQERRSINDRYDKIWHEVFTSSVAFGFTEPNRPTFSVSSEDREVIFQDLWEAGNGFRFLFGGFSDLVTSEAANREAIRFIHEKIREIVKDPQKAEVLISSDLFARRPLTDDKYYQRFSQENVFAVDIKKNPIVAITPEGIQTADDNVHEVDLIVLATGYRTIVSSLDDIDIRGRQGKSLKEHWADGLKINLGAATSNFPNLFFVGGPLLPFSNAPPAIEETARFAADLIARAEHFREGGIGAGVVESTDQADEIWLAEVNRISDSTLFAKTPSPLNNNGDPGKNVSAQVYFGGLLRYRAALAENRANGYPGFQFK